MARLTVPMATLMGMGVTWSGWSDRYAGTVVWVSKSGKTIKVQEDHAERIDANGPFSESQTYHYTFDPTGAIRTFRLTPKGWRGGGHTAALGHRAAYRDPHF